MAKIETTTALRREIVVMTHLQVKGRRSLAAAYDVPEGEKCNGVYHAKSCGALCDS